MVGLPCYAGTQGISILLQINIGLILQTIDHFKRKINDVQYLLAAVSCTGPRKGQ